MNKEDLLREIFQQRIQLLDTLLAEVVENLLPSQHNTIGKQILDLSRKLFEKTDFEYITEALLTARQEAKTEHRNHLIALIKFNTLEEIVENNLKKLNVSARDIQEIMVNENYNPGAYETALRQARQDLGLEEK